VSNPELTALVKLARGETLTPHDRQMVDNVLDFECKMRGCHSGHEGWLDHAARVGAR
jgi:hypothetical protein